MAGTCWKCSHDDPGVPFCSHCGALQEVSLRTSFFEVLGVAPSLKVDPEKLRARFHELAKKLHPDRFAGNSGPEATYSLRWTTLLNRAYQTLRDPGERSYYLLELHGISPERRGGKIPLDLAETYFELQEVESGSDEKLKEFQQQLFETLEATDVEWDELAERWERHDPDAEPEILGDLKELLVKQRYLRSMLQDLESKLGVSGGDRRH